MRHKEHPPPRWVRWTVAALATVLVCAGFGATTARAELSLGPHQALYQVTGDPYLVIDLGPLGRIVADTPLPLGLGVQITVQEIPADLTAVDAPRTLEAMSEDLDAYLQFFDSPEQTVQTASRALIEDAVTRSLVALGVVLLVFFGIREILGARRRGELKTLLAPHTWQITGTAVLALLIGVTAVGSVSARPTPEASQASLVFSGTSMEGARLTGRLARVIDTYSGQLVGLYRNNGSYYAEAQENLVEAWDNADARELAAAAEVPGPGGPGIPGGDDGDSEVGQEGPASTPNPSAGPQPPSDTMTLLLVSDLHCNTGMTSLLRTIVSRSAADLVVNAGDTTINGTDVENVCVDSFATAVRDDVPFVVADGNHDSIVTSTAERAQGQIVLEGDVVEAAGLRILGDRDPLETRIGGGTNAVREETPDEVADRLRDVACQARDDEEPIDLLLVHTPSVGEAGLQSGCVPMQLSGHMHKRIGPERIGYGVRYVNSTSGGASKGRLSVGPLQYPASVTLLRFDTVSREFTQLREIVVDPDQSVSVADWEVVPTAWPLPGRGPVLPNEPR